MRVKSERTCFYHGRRWRPGEVFVLPEGFKPSKDMVIVDGKKVVEEEEKPKTRRRRGNEPETLSEASKMFKDEITVS